MLHSAHKGVFLARDGEATVLVRVSPEERESVSRRQLRSRDRPRSMSADEGRARVKAHSSSVG
jgi:hypothetical protein